MLEINRIWAMPNKNTFEIKPIKELISCICEEYCKEQDRIDFPEYYAQEENMT